MSFSATGYILNVPQHRREPLLNGIEDGGSFYRSKPFIAEPVPNFKHSRHAPLVVFVSFKDNQITHIAEGKRGFRAGTGLVRLNLYDLKQLSRPIEFDELLRGVGTRVRHHLRRVIFKGGILSQKTLEAFVARLIDLDKTLADRLARYTENWREAVNQLSPKAKSSLAFQKETLGLALELGGISRDEIVAWRPAEGLQQSFLSGLPGARIREDAMLFNDFSTLPGFTAIGEAAQYGAKVFKNPEDPSIRMTVVMANRHSLEQQTGADLIYFNEAYRCFVMVQYKAMENGNNGPEFRWKAGDQFVQEIARMDTLLSELKKIPSGNDPDGFRFSNNPFFLKFCPRVLFNPDDKGLFRGIYLPLDLWKRLEMTGKLKGRKGGNVLTFQNVGRRINNSEFIRLIAGSWVGTSIEQSALLDLIIREILASGRTVTFAVKHEVSKDGHSDAVLEDPDNEEGHTHSKPSTRVRRRQGAPSYSTSD